MVCQILSQKKKKKKKCQIHSKIFVFKLFGIKALLQPLDTIADAGVDCLLSYVLVFSSTYAVAKFQKKKDIVILKKENDILYYAIYIYIYI